MDPVSVVARGPTEPAPLEVALVGRQNSGKTSLLMHLTGTAQRPVNFPGTSVERAEGIAIVGDRVIRVVDLPGVASLRAISPDEEVTLDFLRGGGDRVFCAVIDASKLSLELGLLRSLLALEHPLVVALNKADVARAEGRVVDKVDLAEQLGVEVIETDGLRGKGIEALAEALLRAPSQPKPAPMTATPDALAARVQAPPVTSRRTTTDLLDAILLHRVFGLPILMLLMFGMFQLVFSGAEPCMALIEDAQVWASGNLRTRMEAGALRSFMIDALVNGVGSVLVFLPQIALLIGLVTLLEASGYMARAAFLLDTVLRRFGLSGRSFVPMTTSFACAIPGILASRIITNERDRIATIVVAPLMSCSARLPVYVMLIGAFFAPEVRSLVLLGLYLLGIVTAVLVAWILRRTILRGPTSLLMMELPSYQRPSLRVVWGQVRVASIAFIKLAGTIILATSILIWLLSYYPRPAWIHENFERARVEAAALPEAERELEMTMLDLGEQGTYLRHSLLAKAGRRIQPLFEPAGFDWRTTVGILAAFPARELIVPTLGVLHSIGEIDPSEFDLDDLQQDTRKRRGLRWKLRTAQRDDGSGRKAFSALVALSVMVFFALCSQCMATLGAIRRETRTWRWPIFTFVYMTTLAWIAAVVVYQTGRAFGFGPE